MFNIYQEQIIRNDNIPQKCEDIAPVENNRTIDRILGIYPIKWDSIKESYVVCEADKHEHTIIYYTNKAKMDEVHTLLVAKGCEGSYLLADIIGV